MGIGRRSWNWYQTLNYFNTNKSIEPKEIVGYALKEKMESFDLKSWVTGGTKFNPRFRVIGEYLNQIDSILSQFGLNILQLLRIPGRILFPQRLNFLGQNDSIFSFSANA